MPLFDLIQPATLKLPIVISVPHAGTEFPDDIRAALKPGVLPPDDTDWLVNQLYDFATELDIPMLCARYSRWVIDLNRNPDSTPLYRDGRVLTGLCPATNFLGEPIYQDERAEVSAQEIARRKAQYFEPYHQALQAQLTATQAHFGRVLLWDCHSIRRLVPAINPEPFPDLILGSADEASAAPALIERALGVLGSGGYSLTHNHPFKGGYITRHFGQPTQQQHALQLEMAKQVYMNDQEQVYDHQRAAKIRALLSDTLQALGHALLAG